MYRGQKYAELLSVAIYELELLAKKSNWNCHNGETTEEWKNQAGTTAVNLRSLANFIDALRAEDTTYHGCPLDGDVIISYPDDFISQDD